MKRVRNIKDLTQSLVGEYEKLLSGSISPEQANATSHLAGKILTACIVQMRYEDMSLSEPIPFLGSNLGALPRPQVELVEPPRPTLHDVIMHALEMATDPLSEQGLCEKLIADGQLPATYVEDHRYQIGGPYELIRGILLKAAKEDVLTMSTNEEGRAVFQMKRAA